MIDRKRRALRWPHVAALIVTVLACGGCPPPPKPVFHEIPLRDLLPMAEKGLRRPEGIRSTGGHMTVSLVDEQGHKQQHDLDLTLLHKMVRNLYLRGNVLGKTQVEIGSNDKQYWVGVIPQEDTLWWGYWADVEKAKPGNDLIQAPERLLDALGQISLMPPPGKYLGPVLQNRNPYHVLMYLAVDELGLGLWYIAKEISLSEEKDGVFVHQILYYAPDGKKEMQIDLGEYRYVSAENDGGYLPGRIDLDWPGQLKMTLTLGKITNWNIADFEFPDPDAYKVVKQIDP